ncbi:MAG: DUF1456 family protein [Spirochaetia bacterium]|jgi:uncharacterized protein YehS (DUF1456 family)|nr:DUF1456 family protein [Spirochaetia bacterium]
MNNNDILRRVNNILHLDNNKIVEIFNLANMKVDTKQIIGWLKEIEDSEYQKLGDHQLAPFLNGLIDFKRGKKEDAPSRSEKRLNNNIIFTKLKIALNLKSDDILEIMTLADYPLRKLELSAFFRKPENKHYRECKDPVLDAFLKGLKNKYCRLL